MASYVSGAPTPDRPTHHQSGIYPVEIRGAEEKVAKSGNDMIELKLEVLPEDGTLGAFVYDNLVFAPTSGWKIDNFRAALGEKVTPGETVEILADDLIGKTLKVRLTTESWRGANGDQPPKLRNKVAAFILPKEGEALPAARPKPTAQPAAPAKDDNIPF